MRQRRLMNQINVVPYIDVMLVLLVIFMVTAPLVTPSIVELPTVGKASQAPTQPIEIFVKADGSMTVRERARGQQPGSERPVTTAQLPGLIRELQSRSADQPVLIAGDKDVRYEAVMKVMDELQRQNVKRVGLLVRPEGR
jgi:biopolymer transport protein TolR